MKVWDMMRIWIQIDIRSDCSNLDNGVTVISYAILLTRMKDGCSYRITKS